MIHTRGPWRVTHTDYDTQWIEAECGMGVARIAIVDDGAGCQPGNAALIAAAPEMLEALEWLSLHSFTAQNSPQVQSAIRKARGEQ